MAFNKIGESSNHRWLLLSPSIEVIQESILCTPKRVLNPKSFYFFLEMTKDINPTTRPFDIVHVIFFFLKSN